MKQAYGPAFFSRRVVLAAALGAGAVAVMAGCKSGASPRATTRPTTQSSGIAFLRLDEISPRLTLPTTRASDASKASLDAIELFARGRAAMLDNQRFSAIRLFEDAAKADPESFEIQRALSEAYAGSGGSPEKSLASLKRAAELAPDDLETRLRLGRAWMAQEKLEDAIEQFQLARLTSGYTKDDARAAQVDFFLARSLQRRGYHRAAIDLYDRLYGRLEHPSQALLSAPELAYWVSRPEQLIGETVVLYEALGDIPHAIAAARVVAEAVPENFDSWSRIVRLQLRGGDRANAKAQALKVVRDFRANDASIDLLRETLSGTGEGDVLTVLRAAAKEYPDDRAIRFALARQFQTLTRPEDAEAVLREMSQIHPDDTEVLVRLFAMLNARNATLEAANLLIRATARQPDLATDMESQWISLVAPTRRNSLRPEDLNKITLEPAEEGARAYWISWLAYSRRRATLGAASLEKALSFRPVFPPAFHMAALTPTKAGDTALSAIRTLASSPAAGDVEKRVALEADGLSKLTSGRTEEAIKSLEAAIEAGSRSSDIELARATALSIVGDGKRFETEMWKLISDHPFYDGGYRNLLEHYLRNKSGSKSLSVVQNWLLVDPANGPAHVLRAQIFQSLGETDAAKEDIEAALSLKPLDPATLTVGRDVWRVAALSAEWLKRIEQRNREEPGDLVIAQHLVSLYTSDDRLSDGLQVLIAARAACAADVSRLYYISSMHWDRQEFEQGESVLRQALKIDPNHPGVNNDLGYMLADNGRTLDDAERMIRIAVEAEPDNASYLDSLGWVLYKRGQFIQAVVELRKAQLAYDRPSAETMDHLGDALWRTGEKDAANFQWHAAQQRLIETGAVADANAGINSPNDPLEVHLARQIGRKLSAVSENRDPMAANLPIAK